MESLFNVSLKLKRVMVLSVLLFAYLICFAQSAYKIIEKARTYEGAEYITYNESEIKVLYNEQPEDFMKVLLKNANSLKGVSFEKLSFRKANKLHSNIQDLDDCDYRKLIDEKDDNGNILSIWFLEDDDNYLITDVIVFVVQNGQSAMLVYAKGKYPETDIEKVEEMLLP